MRILSLDWDNACQRDLALELEAAGHQVELLSRAAEALACDAERRFDLIVSEVRLPDGNGLQFLRELKEARGDGTAPVVFLTSVEDAEMHRLCRQEGARRYMLKSDGWPAVVADIHGVIAELEPPAATDGPLANAPRAEPRVFRGNLETIDILDIIQLLNLGRKSGVLVLSGGVLDGRIVFDAGEIVAATNHDQSGQSAFATLLTLKRGSFRFEAGPPEVERTIHQPTSSLLLDALREQDESGRTSHAGAPGSADDDAAFDFEHRREAAPDGWLYAGVEQTPDAGPEETASARGPEVPSLLGQDPFGLSLAPAIEAGPSLEPPHAVASSPSPIEPQLFQAPEPRPSRSAEPRPAGVTETDPLPELPAQPIVLSLPPGGGRTFLLRGRSGRKGRLPRRLAIGVAAASILLASGYALFSPALRRSDGVVEGADYRRLVLEAAANQAKIDSLEQVVQGLTNSVRTGDVSQSDAARQISRLQTEIHQASADLDVARRAADAKLDTDRRGEGTGGDAPAASPGGERAAEVSRSPAASRIVQTLADSNSSVLRADLDAEPAAAADDGSPATEAARPAAEVSSLDVVPVDVAIPAASAPADVPASSPAAGADYSLTALRNGPTFVPVDTRPTPRASLHPQYPPALAARNIGGTVTLWTLVDGSGRVEDVRVLRSSGQPELDKAATDAIRLAAFKPARRNGVAVPAWTQQQVAFRLD